MTKTNRIKFDELKSNVPLETMKSSKGGWANANDFAIFANYYEQVTKYTGHEDCLSDPWLMRDQTSCFMWNADKDLEVFGAWLQFNERFDPSADFCDLEEYKVVCDTAEMLRVSPQLAYQYLGDAVAIYNNFGHSNNYYNTLQQGAETLMNNFAGTYQWQEDTYNAPTNSSNSIVYPDGYCTVASMAHLGSLVRGGKTDIDCYIDTLAEMWNKPSIVVAADLEHFGIGPSEGETSILLSTYYNNTKIFDLPSLVSSLQNGYPVYALLINGNGKVGHAVVFEGYNSTTGAISYWDPTTGTMVETNSANPISTIDMYRIDGTW